MAKVKLRQVAIIPFAKWQALLGFISGIFMGVIYGSIALVNYGFAELQSNPKYFLWYFFATPIMYGVVTFIATLIGGLIYNASSKSRGGMEFDVEIAEVDDAPPQPSEQFL